MKLNHLSELLFDQTRELHCIESAMTRLFPLLSGSVSNLRLRKLLWERALCARDRRDMLDTLQLCHGQTRRTQVCHTIKGILTEGNKRLESIGNFYTKDLVMIGQCMRIEHDAIIAYRIVSRLAERAGFPAEADQMLRALSELEAARIPFQSLEEELFRTAELRRSAGHQLEIQIAC